MQLQASSAENPAYIKYGSWGGYTDIVLVFRVEITRRINVK